MDITGNKSLTIGELLMMGGKTVWTCIAGGAYGVVDVQNCVVHFSNNSSKFDVDFNSLGRSGCVYLCKNED